MEKTKVGSKRKGANIDNFVQSKLIKPGDQQLSYSSLVGAAKSAKEFQAKYDSALIKLLSNQHMSFLEVT